MEQRCRIQMQIIDTYIKLGGKASNLLSRVLSKYNLKNLDELFPDKTLTTTEFLAR